jgi:polysaccharide pyruvyl transferase WcaK-like protein
MQLKGNEQFYSADADDLVMGDADISSTEDSSLAKRPRILMLADICGLGPGYHVGDEAMAEVAIERLKGIAGEDNLVMACARPEAVPATYGIAAFPLYAMTDRQRRRQWLMRPHSALKSWLLMLYHVIRCDIVFVCGGGNLTSVWPGVLESRLGLFSVAKFFNKRLILVSQTLGPFSPAHRERCGRILGRAEWVGVRDKTFSSNQVDFPVHFAVDDAAFLAPEHNDRTRQLLRPKPMLALSLRQLGATSRAQLLEIGRAVNRVAVARGMDTVFIPHHSPGGAGDLAVAKDLQQAWPSRTSFRVVDAITRAAALKALTADCNLAISMRYHQLIFALSTGVPAIGIYTDRYTRAKLRGAFEQFDLEPRILPLHAACEQLSKMVDLVLSEGEQFRRAAQRPTEQARSNNLKALHYVEELCSGEQ